MRNWRISRPQVTDCSFTGNTATDDGGAVFNNDDCYMPLADSVVCGNTPDQIFGPLNDQGGNLIADVCTACIEADLDGDGTVDIADVLVLLAAWGSNPEHPADLNGDGLVGIVDFLELLAAWSDCR
jgi:predicted outer membrane repeat protein